MANITCKLKILSVLLRAVIIRAWTLGNMFLQFDRGRVYSCLLSSHWLIDTNLVYLKEDTSPNVFRAILVETVSNSLNRTDFWLKKSIWQYMNIYELLLANQTESTQYLRFCFDEQTCTSLIPPKVKPLVKMTL